MGYIFETEIGQIMNAVRARTIGEAEAITLREIAKSKIHRAIKAYFKAEVERNLEQERQLEVRSKRFPYSTAEVASLQHQTDILLTYHYQFNQHEFHTLLDQAVHFTFNFLCRPQFTLMGFLFENQRRMSTALIERKLQYCANYEYYVLLLKRYFTEKGLAEITYEEFRDLLSKIDREVVSRHSSQELANMTKAIIGFVDAVREPQPNAQIRMALPVNAAIVFFEDKGLVEIKLRLEYERDHNGLQEIDLTKLAEIIDEVRLIASGKTPEPPKSGTASEQFASDEQAPEQAIGDHAIEIPDSFSPTPQAEVEPGKSSTEVNESEPEAVDNTTQVALSNLPDLHLMFSESEQKKIIKSLFHRDDPEFRATLDVLNQATSWEDASLILDDLFVARDLDPQSKAAIMLTEKVFGRYKSISD